MLRRGRRKLVWLVNDGNETAGNRNIGGEGFELDLSSGYEDALDIAIKMMRFTSSCQDETNYRGGYVVWKSRSITPGDHEFTLKAEEFL